MGNAEEKYIYFITGASGVGKTSLLTHLKNRNKNMPWSFFHFDSIGVPPVVEMEKEFGSPSRWQEAKTHEWIDRLINRHHEVKIFIEGQVNLQFIQTGFQKHNFTKYKIILVDCSEEKMEYRLTHQRVQPELFNHAMRDWLKFLRNQAKELGVAVIDNSDLSGEESAIEFEKLV